MKYELTSPAGSLEICEAVIAAGADAVYLGGEKFSARAFAPNFSEQEILRALDIAHIHGRRIYLAVNTLLKNRETGRELYNYIRPFYEQGLDAIIVQDYGVFQFVRKYFPDLPVNISTQMSVANPYGADFLRRQGAKRIVAARELTLGEIRAIHENTDIEIECFVHGAMCYCYSGQCLMSSMIGGRSGNRGRCAQPCRLPYKVVDSQGRAVGGGEGYPLSLKDMCAIDLLPQLCEAGAVAFKIEGRMKSLAYAAGVTRIYRRYLDLYESDPEHYEVLESDRNELLALGNRSGFTEGYYRDPSGRGMVTMSDPSHTSGEAGEVYEPAVMPRIPVKGHVTLRPGEALTLTAAAVSTHDGEDQKRKMAVSVTGERVQQAKRHPLDAGQVRTRLEKTGETPFEFESLEVEMDDECFVPVGQLNELRRKALNGLQEEILREFRRSDPGREKEAGRRQENDTPATPDTKKTPTINVQVCTREQLEEALTHPFVDMISLDPYAFGEYFNEKGRFMEGAFIRDIDEARSMIAAAGKQSGYCFPYVFRGGAYLWPEWKEALGEFDALWVRSFDSLGFCLSLTEGGEGQSAAPRIRREQIRLDAGMYVFSDQTWQSFSELGIGGYTSPFELNGGELAHMPNGQAQFTVYGYVPVMVSAQCVYSNCVSCMKDRGEETRFYLYDRYFNKFFIKRNCKESYNVIYNSRPLSLFHRAEEIGRLGFGSLRIMFTDEDREQASGILRECRTAFAEGRPVPAPRDSESYTNGHFRRGVD